MNEKVAQTFRQLYLDKRTGVLMCEGDVVRRAIFFRSGFVVGARSNRAEDRLGEVLIRHGRITSRQFEDASHFIKSGWRMGEILAELGVVDRAEVEEYLGIQLLEITCSVLVEPPKRVTFSELSSVDSVVFTPLSVANILMEAARSTPNIETFRKQLLEDKRELGFSSDPLLRFQDVKLTPEEAFILSRVDGNQPTQAIFAVSPLPEEQTARTLLGLIQAGVIEPEGEEGHQKEEPVVERPAEVPLQKIVSDDSGWHEIEKLFEEFQAMDHWQVLGLDRGAGTEEVKVAFHEKARLYHPDRFRRFADAEIQEKITCIFNRVREAFETLSTKSEEYEKLAEKEDQYEEKKKAWTSPAEVTQAQLARTRHPSEAKALFARAKAAFDQDDHWNTIQFCQQAIEIVSDQAEYYHLLGLALSQNPKWRLDAEKNFKIAMSLDPWKGKYLAALGRLYNQAGMGVRAVRMFEQAKAVDPNFAMPDE